MPYLVAGGKLIVVVESSRIAGGGIAALLESREFGGFIEVRDVHRARQAFVGRDTIQVGITKMRAPDDADFSRELAHAEVLWGLVSIRKNRNNKNRGKST